jgi:hypothetical protein
MRKATVLVVVSVGVLATLWTAPMAGAEGRIGGRGAGRSFGGDRSFHTHGHSFPRHGLGHGFGHSFPRHGLGHGFGHHRFSPRHFVTFGAVIAPPVVVYSPPLVYAPPPSYAAPVFTPPPVYSSAVYAQPTPVPRVVEYSTGRYELRGDGIGTPYTWVWIPNPPPAPPPAPAAPPTAPPAAAPASGDAPPARRTAVYRWVDEHGVVHLTDRSETVPPRYRAEAKGS